MPTLPQKRRYFGFGAPWCLGSQAWAGGQQRAFDRGCRRRPPLQATRRRSAVLLEGASPFDEVVRHEAALHLARGALWKLLRDEDLDRHLHCQGAGLKV